MNISTVAFALLHGAVCSRSRKGMFCAGSNLACRPSEHIAAAAALVHPTESDAQ